MKQSPIADQNDKFRSGQSAIPGRIVVTSSINALPVEEIEEILQKVKEYDSFTEDNDPYGEHDFGRFSHNEQTFLWKIDYFDPTLQFHSEDKEDISKTVRVLTIMYSHEY
jgi:hypothetical protein